MKVAIGYRVREAPWGGGNRCIAALVEALGEARHSASTTLDDDDIDIILIVDPRGRNPSTSFTPGAVERYLAWRNPGAIVVHRINECDERKGTRTMNARLRLANACADHTVFIGSWLRDLAVWQANGDGRHSVILNGADRRTFNAERHQPWDGAETLRLVTHHWGGNWMKGFDVYAKLDRMLAAPAWRNRIEFTYIGNLPDGFRFSNARSLPPSTGDELADELRRSHVYLTASINEPAGMHHVEGALCGLPLIFRNSGALPEYCTGFGEAFEGDEFEPALEDMMANYPRWSAAVADYPRTAERMTAAYIALFEELLAERETIIARRRKAGRLVPFLLNQIPW